ncbi:23S rRNA (adenine(1618)-N(6))-methyltransferase RlmF [Hymenobacter nivis]|uniref:Ribosomal RNA large subunit methyltransferase F n=1 Tax=Hymenobacter nivis TaxID=1850093 RepID=A0A502GXU7_9BACT|nr:23S rRNA (adenine(1618)-N(6))-methyltransferase RlmF [Hymenobacter nivis]TPG66178.1 23S rRNA (adenine(1618)-N(6))-methyltransferase RlmF [Hymenobacter nivis]
MPSPPPNRPAPQGLLHPRNRHRGRYDFPQLISSSPALAAFVRTNPFGDLSVDFANPVAVKALNQALLRHFYGVAHWDIPAGYLCPPIPGRADYVHHVADLLAASNGGVVPRGPGVRVLDVGVGANCIYPLIGHHEYGWQFVGSDIDAVALRAAQQLVAANGLAKAIEGRLQPDARRVFDGIIGPGEVFDATLCNPPFHASAAEAAAGTQRKTANLGTARGPRPVLNFGGQAAELWAPGGEAAFVRRLVLESQQRPTACFWYTTLVSKKETLPGLHRALHQAGALETQTIDMAQGQKKSRLVAWTFLTPAQQAAWRRARWSPQRG